MAFPINPQRIKNGEVKTNYMQRSWGKKRDENIYNNQLFDNQLFILKKNRL